MLRQAIPRKALYTGVAIALALLAFNTPAHADLLAFFDFNDASDPEVAVDISDKGNHGDVLEGEYTDPGGGRTGGANDRAMDLGDNFSDAYVDVPSAFDGALESLVENDTATLTMWIYGSDEQPVDQWMFFVGGGTSRELGSHIPWSNGNIYFDVAGCCEANQRLTANEPDDSLYSGEWNHYAFVKNTEDTAIYQNGELWLDSDQDWKDPLGAVDIDTFRIGAGPDGDIRSYSGLVDDFGLWDEALSEEQINDIMENGIASGGDPPLKAGDANMDYQFNQLDLVQVQIAATYLSGTAATWGEGDWDGAPGGAPGSPPAGDGQFNQLDIISALNADTYLKGDYRALTANGAQGDGQTSITYDPGTGEVGVDAPTGTELTSINIDSAAGIFTGVPAENLGGSFDNDADNNIFKATFGSSFGSLSFGAVAQAGLSEEVVMADLTAVGSLNGGGDLGTVDLIYVPEPSTLFLILLGIIGLIGPRRR